MKPEQNFDSFPSFANAGSRSAPEGSKYGLGFLTADTFPAEWANYFFHGSTKGITDLNSAVKSIWEELLTILSHASVTPDAKETDQVYNSIKSMVDNKFAGAAPKNHASSATTYGVGTASNYGHLKISDTYTSVISSGTGVAASQKAVANVYSLKVDKTTTVNGHALSSNVTVTKSDVGLGNVVNTGDSATPVSGGTTKFTTGGAYTQLNKKADKVSNATADNLASLDANGNLTDSGVDKNTLLGKVYATYQNSSTKVIRLSLPTGYYYTLLASANAGNAWRNLLISISARTPYVSVVSLESSTNYEVRYSIIDNNLNVYIRMITSDSTVIINKLSQPINASGTIENIAVTELTTSSNEWTEASVVTPVSLYQKADKVINATADHLASLDSNGNLQDSGINKDIVPTTASALNKLSTPLSEIVVYATSNFYKLTGTLTYGRPAVFTVSGSNGNLGFIVINQLGSSTSSVKCYWLGGKILNVSLKYISAPSSGLYAVQLIFNRADSSDGQAIKLISAGTVNESTWTQETSSQTEFNEGTLADSIFMQNQILSTPITIGGISRTTVEHALSALQSSKADKPSSSTNGHLAGLNASGNLTDSGIAISDIGDQVTYSLSGNTLTITTK